VHEFAHVLYAERLFPLSDVELAGHPIFAGDKIFLDEDWRKIYSWSGKKINGVKYSEIFDDSNYLHSSYDYVGHPDDNPDELFASAFMVFSLFEKEMRENSKVDPEISKFVNRVEDYFNKIYGPKMQAVRQALLNYLSYQ
jgi:hypothetical protein